MQRLLSALVLAVAVGLASWSATAQAPPPTVQGTPARPQTGDVRPSVDAAEAERLKTEEARKAEEARQDREHLRFLSLMGVLLILVIGLLAALQWRFQRVI